MVTCIRIRYASQQREGQRKGHRYIGQFKRNRHQTEKITESESGSSDRDSDATPEQPESYLEQAKRMLKSTQSGKDTEVLEVEEDIIALDDDPDTRFVILNSPQFGQLNILP
jgi:hypothetical protein